MQLLLSLIKCSIIALALVQKIFGRNWLGFGEGDSFPKSRSKSQMLGFSNSTWKHRDHIRYSNVWMKKHSSWLYKQQSIRVRSRQDGGYIPLCPIPPAWAFGQFSLFEPMLAQKDSQLGLVISGTTSAPWLTVYPNQSSYAAVSYCILFLASALSSHVRRSLLAKSGTISSTICPFFLCSQIVQGVLPADILEDCVSVQLAMVIKVIYIGNKVHILFADKSEAFPSIVAIQMYHTRSFHYTLPTYRNFMPYGTQRTRSRWPDGPCPRIWSHGPLRLLRNSRRGL